MIATIPFTLLFFTSVLYDGNKLNGEDKTQYQNSLELSKLPSELYVAAGMNEILAKNDCYLHHVIIDNVIKKNHNEKEYKDLNMRCVDKSMQESYSYQGKVKSNNMISVNENLLSTSVNVHYTSVNMTTKKYDLLLVSDPLNKKLVLLSSKTTISSAEYKKIVAIMQTKKLNVNNFYLENGIDIF